MTDHDDQYDPQLEWVIEEVIFSITQQKQTPAEWFAVYEAIYDTTADEAWDEYQAQQRAEAEGEARYNQERDDAETYTR